MPGRRRPACGVGQHGRPCRQSTSWFLEGDEETVVHPTGGMSLHESFSFLWGQPNPDIFRIKPIDKTTFRVIPIERDSANFKYIDVSVKNGFVDKATVYDHLDGTSILHFHGWILK